MSVDLPTRSPASSPYLPGPSVAVFVDLSNLFYGARSEAVAAGESPAAIRLESDQLARLLRADRHQDRGVVVANDEVPREALSHFARLGEVIVREAGRRTGTEQASDETLLNRMYETISQRPRGTLVLATGDGAGAARGRGFIPALESARERGWGIEVVAWASSVNKRLLEWLTRTGSVFVNLSDQYFAVTFVERGRRAQQVMLAQRPFAVPRSRSGAVARAARVD